MSRFMSNFDVAAGQELVPLVKPPIMQEQLRRYAEASGDFNPIHLDEQAAHRFGLDTVIAHVILSMAFLRQFSNLQISGISCARLDRLRVHCMYMGDM